MDSVRGKVVAVVGATATGKSDWGMELSRRFGGEVLSADSRQVYVGMDLGTGKVPGTPESGVSLRVVCPERVFDLVPQVSESVRHWLLDVVEPAWPFTVAHYQKLGQAVIEHVLAAGRLPVLVGGTGLYVRALLDGLVFPEVPAVEEVRALSLAELQERLRRVDPAAEVDWHNPHRVMRAIEIVEGTGQPLAVARRLQPPSFAKLVVGIAMEAPVLHQRIHLRLLQRLEAGMVEEVRGLLQAGLSPQRLEGFGLEYRYVGRYLAGQLSYEAMVAQLELSIIQYARRQLTWFRKHGEVHWVGSVQEALALAGEFLAA